MRLSWKVAWLVLAWALPLTAAALTPLEKALLDLGEQHKRQALGNSVTAGASLNLMDKLSGGANPRESETASWGNSLLAQVQDPLALKAAATDLEVVLSWSNTAAAWSQFFGYQVTREELDGDFRPLTTQPITQTTYQDLSVTAGTVYLYRVSAVDAAGNTLLESGHANAKLLPPIPPGVPADFEALSEEEQVRLKWKAPVKSGRGVAGYLIYRSGSAEGPWETLNHRLLSRETFFDSTGLYQQEYYYRVAAVDARGLTGEATAALPSEAQPRNRSGLVLMSTAYPGPGGGVTGLTGDLQFTYYIGTLYGEQAPEVSPLAVYLDPISLWLLSGDLKFSFLSEATSPVALAAGMKGMVQLFAGQQSAASGSLTITGKSELDYLWGAYLTASRTVGSWGIHGGYAYGPASNFILYLSKYLEPEATQHLVYLGTDFPIVRRMNATLEILYPLDATLQSRQHPLLVNLHVDRLLNFDISFLRWDQGWAFLGYFNLRFTLFSTR